MGLIHLHLYLFTYQFLLFQKNRIFRRLLFTQAYKFPYLTSQDEAHLL